MLNVNTKALQITAVANFRVPKEGAMVIPLVLDFTKDTVYTLQLAQLEQQTRFSMLQSIYADLSQTDSAVTINIADVNQTIVAKGRTDGYYTVMNPNPSTITFTSAANAILTVHLCNSPIPGVVWATQ